MKKWQVKPSAPAEFKSQFANIDTFVADLLYHRGLKSQKEIDEFLTPDYKDLHDPFLFKQMDIAVARVNEAIAANQKITVHGDYDADGLGGAVILVSTLKYLGATEVDVYLPDREKEGYGLNTNTVNYLHEKGTNLIITCDCGISNATEIAEAKGLGIDVIVTDHHTVPKELPPCIILHPKVEGETYPFNELAGGGVAFKLAQALLQAAAKASPEKAAEYQAFEKWLLDMVAISTVADMVPLIGENRILVKYGLIVLGKARRPGLRGILKNAGLWPPKHGNDLHLSTYHIGFVVGPRLNAAGRMDHANSAFVTLMAETDSEAQRLADILEQSNKERQVLTSKMFEEAMRQIGQVNPREAQVLFAYDPSWSMGIVGLIAGRVMERMHKPVFVCSQLNGKIAGSGRSIEGYDCVEALNKASDLLLKFGGHARACGFTIKDNAHFPELKERFSGLAREKLKPGHLVQKLVLDAQLPISNTSWDFYDDIQKFAPFGMANPEPKFLSKNCEVVEVSAVGADGNHLRLAVKDIGGQVTRKCIAFRQGEWNNKLTVGSKIDIVYTVDVNEWNGNRELQLKIEDLRLSR